MEVAYPVCIFTKMFQFAIFFRWKRFDEKLFHKFVMLYVRCGDRLKSDHTVWVLSLTILFLLLYRILLYQMLYQMCILLSGEYISYMIL